MFPIRFAFDRWDLESPYDLSVKQAAALLADPRCQDRKVEVTGHADYYGGRLYNEALSIRRAQVVVDALVAAGVAANRLSVTGRGEKAPDADAHTREARAKNRRVVLTIVK